MLGVDEHQRCYKDDCQHALAGHETQWVIGLDGKPCSLEIGVCRVDGCFCSGYLPDIFHNLGERPWKASPNDGPVSPLRTLYSVRWDYHTIAAPAGTARPKELGDELDVEIAKLGREGWELVLSENLGTYRIYRFKRPTLVGS